MQNINLYKSLPTSLCEREEGKKPARKYIYNLVAVFALGSLVISQLALPMNAFGFDDFYGELYSGDPAQYDEWYSGGDDYSDWYSGDDYGDNPYYGGDYNDYSGYNDYGYNSGNAYDIYGGGFNNYDGYDYTTPAYQYVYDDDYNYYGNGYDDFGGHFGFGGYSGGYDADFYFDGDFDYGFGGRFDNFDHFQDFQDIEIVNNNINENFIDIEIDERPRVVPVVRPVILIPNPDLRVDKRVRNLTTGSGFSESIDALVGDRVRFEIEIQNIGNVRLHNVTARDELDSRLSFISGTLFVASLGNSGSIGSAGINIGSLSVGETAVIAFDAQVLGGQDQTLFNAAFARADEAAERSDIARVRVNFQPVIVPVPVPLPIIVNDLVIIKSVRNITLGQSALLASADARQDDRLLFSIEVRPSAGSFLQNIRIKDDLPVGLNYVLNSTRVDNFFVSDGITTSGINLGSLSGGQGRFVSFEVTVGGVFTPQTLTNVARASADGVAERSAFAQVRVAARPQPAPQLLVLRKIVENLTSPNGTQTDNNALVGATLRYSLAFQNTSSAVLNDVRIIDVLPSNTVFASAADSGAYNSSTNAVTWNIGSLASGASVNVSYRVKVAQAPAGTVIVNAALLRAQNIIDVISNETRTRIGAVQVAAAPLKGAPVKAVSGSDSLTANFAYSLIISLIFAAVLYFGLKYTDALRALKLKWTVLRIKMREGV